MCRHCNSHRGATAESLLSGSFYNRTSEHIAPDLREHIQPQEWVETLSHHERSIARDRKSTRLNSSHLVISYAVFCLKKKNPIHVGVCEFVQLAVPHRRSAQNQIQYLLRLAR